MPASSVQTDVRQLAQMAAIKADHERFLALVESHRRALLKVCWAYTRTSHDRDDLLQETIARLWATFHSYDGSRPFMTWLYRVALNVAIDFRRRQQRWRREGQSLGEHLAPDDAAKSEQLRDLKELLDRQDDADRAILLLYLESHSYREIGEVLGISETNVGTRLNRLKKSMRQSAMEPGN